MSLKQAKFVVGPALVVAALVWIGYTAFEGTLTYYRTVPELYAMAGDLDGRNLRIQGEVLDGSIVRRSDGVDFVISEEGQVLNVRYVGKDPVPDTFANNPDKVVSAIVTGQYDGDGQFTATGIQAQCTSKYEADLDGLAPEGAEAHEPESFTVGSGF